MRRVVDGAWLWRLILFLHAAALLTAVISCCNIHAASAFSEEAAAGFASIATASSIIESRERTLPHHCHRTTGAARYGWLQDYFEPNKKSSSPTPSRQVQYPEQYPATYEINTEMVQEDDETAKFGDHC
jgi:hypothetical protein